MMINNWLVLLHLGSVKRSLADWFFKWY